ncbi:MAG: helix-turn-helix transcriptional regulator [Bacteroidales bacterium]|nr:helix-turn-helix transcriptional regulator [Bacteroidales bacterium]
MDQENLTPARFADKLEINRAIISHILNGRNNPSLDVVTRILNEMSYINAEWLLTGEGNMYKKEENEDPSPMEPDLFSQGRAKPEEPTVTPEKSKGSSVNSPDYRQEPADNKEFEPIKQPPKEIAQIIVYYNDKTFDVFRP